MRSGPMRHKLIFQTLSEASDGSGAGGGTQTWADTVTAWAEKWSVKSDERVEAARTKQNSIHRWRVRANAAIVPSMRIKWGTRYQEVIAVNPLGNRGTELEVFAEEKI